jgi:hypothetical protein
MGGGRVRRRRPGLCLARGRGGPWPAPPLGHDDRSDPSALPGGLLFVRALLPGTALLALAGTGGALGGPWLGVALGAGLWFLNLLDPTALWLDRATAGALHLFALTRGSATAPGPANRHQAVAALALLVAALEAPAAARRIARHSPSCSET